MERLFRYLKERADVLHDRLSAKDYVQGVKNSNPLLNLFTLYYQTLRIGGGQPCLSGHYPITSRNIVAGKFIVEILPPHLEYRCGFRVEDGAGVVLRCGVSLSGLEYLNC